MNNAEAINARSIGLTCGILATIAAIVAGMAFVSKNIKA